MADAPAKDIIWNPIIQIEDLLVLTFSFKEVEIEIACQYFGNTRFMNKGLMLLTQVNIDLLLLLCANDNIKAGFKIAKKKSFC